MVALIVTFFASVFIYQPVKILLITFVVTACCKRANFDDDHQETDEVMPSVYWDEEAEAEARYVWPDVASFCQVARLPGCQVTRLPG